MLDSISFSRFYDINSDIRKMNPISKILCVLLFLILTFVESSIEFNLILLTIVLFIICISNIPFKVYGKILSGLLSFIVLIFVINFLCKNDVSLSILYSIRLILIVLYSSVLTMTTPPTELVYGLEKILSPLKIFRLPVHSLALTLSLAIRFIPTVFEQCKKIIKANEGRGIKFQNLSFRLKLTYIKSLIIPIFVFSLKNSDELADAMTLKLYNVNAKRTDLFQNVWHKIDAYMLCFHVMLLFILIMKGIC